jgi:hypothetical protein
MRKGRGQSERGREREKERGRKKRKRKREREQYNLARCSKSLPGPQQGCQIYFKTKNPNLGIFWKALEWKMLVYFTAFWYNLRPFGVIYGRLV